MLHENSPGTLAGISEGEMKRETPQNTTGQPQKTQVKNFISTGKFCGKTLMMVDLFRPPTKCLAKSRKPGIVRVSVPGSVTVAQQFLVLFVKVRILAG